MSGAATRLGIAVVVFDASEGPLVHRLDGTITLSADERTALSTAALPDSEGRDGALGTQLLTFHFEGRDIWCFSLYRAVRDPDVPRGVSQSALVLLAEHPLLDEYRAAVAHMADAPHRWRDTPCPHVESATPRSVWRAGCCLGLDDLCPRCCRFLANADESVAAWMLQSEFSEPSGRSTLPSPLDGAFNGLTVRVRPAYAQLLAAGLGASCWRLWQLLLCGETLRVFAPSAQHASETAIALTCLLAPLPFAASQLRPHVTVHHAHADAIVEDGAWPHTAARGGGGGGVVFSVANHYFLKGKPPPRLATLHLGEAPATTGSAGAPASPEGAGEGAGNGAAGAACSAACSAAGSAAGGAAGGAAGRAATPQLHAGGIEPLVRPDAYVLRQLEAAREQRAGGTSSTRGEGGGDVRASSLLLQHHFGSLTASFLSPLERFGAMGSLRLAPPPATRGAGEPLALLERFDAERFLDEVCRLQPQPLPKTIVPGKAELRSLYERFLGTEHFRLWWEARRERAVAESLGST